MPVASLCCDCMLCAGLRVKTEPQGFPDSKESLALLAVMAGLGDPESTEAP